MKPVIRPRIMATLMAVTLVSLLLLVVWVAPQRTIFQYRCPYCAAKRTYRQWGPVPVWDVTWEDQASRWLAASRPGHKHVWLCWVASFQSGWLSGRRASGEVTSYDGFQAFANGVSPAVALREVYHSRHAIGDENARKIVLELWDLLDTCGNDIMRMQAVSHASREVIEEAQAAAGRDSR